MIHYDWTQRKNIQSWELGDGELKKNIQVNYRAQKIVWGIIVESRIPKEKKIHLVLSRVMSYQMHLRIKLK